MLWLNLYKIKRQVNLNYGDESQTSGYSESKTFGDTRKIVYFDLGWYIMRYNITFGYTLDYILLHALKNIHLICFAFKFKMESDITQWAKWE